MEKKNAANHLKYRRIKGATQTSAKQTILVIITLTV